MTLTRYCDWAYSCITESAIARRAAPTASPRSASIATPSAVRTASSCSLPVDPR